MKSHGPSGRSGTAASAPTDALRVYRLSADRLLKDLRSDDDVRVTAAAERFTRLSWFSPPTVARVLEVRATIRRKHALDVVAQEAGHADWRELAAHSEASVSPESSAPVYDPDTGTAAEAYALHRHYLSKQLASLAGFLPKLVAEPLPDVTSPELDELQWWFRDLQARFDLLAILAVPFAVEPDERMPDMMGAVRSDDGMTTFMPAFLLPEEARQGYPPSSIISFPAEDPNAGKRKPAGAHAADFRSYATMFDLPAVQDERTGDWRVVLVEQDNSVVEGVALAARTTFRGKSQAELFTAWREDDDDALIQLTTFPSGAWALGAWAPSYFEVDPIAKEIRLQLLRFQHIRPAEGGRLQAKRGR